MSESFARIALLLFGILGCLAGFCFLRSYRHLRPGPDAVRRRAILQGSLSRQDLFTQEGWALRLRGWIFTGLALLVLVAWGLLLGDRSRTGPRPYGPNPVDQRNRQSAP